MLILVYLYINSGMFVYLYSIFIVYYDTYYLLYISILKMLCTYFDCIFLVYRICVNNYRICEKGCSSLEWLKWRIFGIFQPPISPQILVKQMCVWKNTTCNKSSFVSFLRTYSSNALRSVGTRSQLHTRKRTHTRTHTHTYTRKRTRTREASCLTKKYFIKSYQLIDRWKGAYHGKLHSI